MVTVLKLGGSVITDKDRCETVDSRALGTCAKAIAVARDDLVVVHGGGSFGHFHAARYGVTVESGTDDIGEIAAIHDSMATLNEAVVHALSTRAVSAVGFSPLAAAYRDRDGALSMPTGAVSTMLDGGFVPVLYGDVIADARAGFTILSGDELVVSLAAALDADRIGLCSAVPGVLGSEGEVIERIGRFADVEDAIGDSSGTDVTGGMAGKVRTLLELSMPSMVFGLDDLRRFLAGQTVGTVIEPT